MRCANKKSNIKIYAGLTVACGIIAVIAHFLFEAPDRVRAYAEAELDSAVRSAVKSEVRTAAQEAK
ncbi:MAG: hypothetical protein CME13_09875 [Gemmatimonadetes bacterium]|nr:hypothetical protein [Gemmatimonadota bacterium]MDP7632160.1 hypothetical protein [Candidatus Latescibacterota bacterium]HCV24953.1 hypothetical protein [Candidatus Latescibacterota bacterium]